MSLRRPLLYLAAALFAAFELGCLYTWFTSGGSLARAWAALRSDAALFMAWTDMAVFTAVVLVWLWRDLSRSGKTRLYWWATLFTGCPPLLVYLARRPG